MPQCWVSVLFYGYALAKDYSDGSYYRENEFVETRNAEDLASLLQSTEAGSDAILPTHSQNTPPLPPSINHMKSSGNKVHSSRFNAIAKRNAVTGK